MCQSKWSPTRVESYYLVLSDKPREYAYGGFVVFGAGVACACFGQKDWPEPVLEEIHSTGRDAGIGIDAANCHFFDALVAQIFQEMKE